ncbi:hypothetical protein AGMMS49965_19040 [Bacteroidia bacterium]|nr:hypothetical protein AGMMS49965_19040 [Bacteroidia bacterium]
MKKTLTINLNGTVFNVDEDAYKLLENYLRNLRHYFRREEGLTEIMSDIEARIGELFSNYIRLGRNVVDISEVESVIAQVGQPADFGENDGAADAGSEHATEPGAAPQKKFYRDPDRKLIGGLCSGLAAYFNSADVLPIRIIAIILLFVPYFPAVIAYLLFWIFIPEAKTAEEKLKMRGQAVTVENIGKIVSNAAESAKQAYQENKNGCLGGFVNALAGFFKVCLAIFGIIIGLPLVFALFIAFIVLFSVLFGVGGSLLSSFPFLWGSASIFNFTHPVLASSMLIVLLILPLGVLIYSILEYFGKLKPVHVGIKWAGFGVWLVALILLLCSGCRINRHFPIHHWNVHFSDGEVFEGNGVQAEKSIAFAEAIERVTVEDHLIANLQIEQVAGESTTILISGDENLLDKITAEWDNGELRLSTDNKSNLRPQKNFNIILQTPVLKEITLHSFGKISINNSFTANDLRIKLEGAGSIQADSLTVQSLTVNAEGVGSITVAGTAKNANLHLDGAGEIEAANLLSETVTAHLEGIGKIACNPTQHLDAEVEGIGKITYKTEPKTMRQEIDGLGKIKKE